MLIHIPSILSSAVKSILSSCQALLLFTGALPNLQDLDSLKSVRPSVVWQRDGSTSVYRGCLPSAAQPESFVRRLPQRALG